MDSLDIKVSMILDAIIDNSRYYQGHNFINSDTKGHEWYVYVIYIYHVDASVPFKSISMKRF